MFFFRRDKRLKRAISRRLKSPRGSAYLEFAIVLPIVVMVVSAMFEFTAYWDAKIMANHAAWTCARIATVRAGEREPPKNENDRKPLIAKRPTSISQIKNTDGMYLATAMLMSTCSMGSMHGSTANLVQDWVTSLVENAVASIKGMIENAIKDEFAKISESVGNLLPSKLGGKLLSKAFKAISDGISKKVLDPLATKLSDAIFRALPLDLSKSIAKHLDNSRVARQLVYAADRMASYDDIITVAETLPVDEAMTATKKDFLTDFPATFDRHSTCDDWMVLSASGWPPNRQSQRMITVTIKWPFERAWMFPVLSSAGKSTGTPRAVGHALFYPQPTIKNANLDSASPEAFAEAETNKMDGVNKELESLKNLFGGFLKIALLSYDYRLREELIGPYDSDPIRMEKKKGFLGIKHKEQVGNVFSYKGIGCHIGDGNWSPTDFTTKDGLVFWMDRAPENTSDQNAWKTKACPADYGRCFRALTGATDERCAFYRYKPLGGKVLLNGATPVLGKLKSPVYHAKEWFYWGARNTAHLRYDHGSVFSLSAMTKLWGDSPEFLKDEDWIRIGLASLAEMNLSKGRFEAIRPQDGAGADLEYETWREFVRANGSRYSLNANALFKMQTSRASEITTLETDVFLRRVMILVGKHVELNSLVNGCRAELKAIIEKGEKKKEGEADQGSSGPDMSMMPSLNEAMQELAADPVKGVEKLRKAFEELKTNITELLYDVDAAERNARDAYCALTNRIATVSAHRREMIEEWVSKTAAAMSSVGYLDPDVVARVQKAKFPMSVRDWAADTEALVAASQAYEDALDRLKEAEMKFANALGLKSQSRFEDLSFDSDTGPKPEVPDLDGLPTSTSASGSDDDRLGDFWNLTTEGWKKQGGATEDR